MYTEERLAEYMDEIRKNVCSVCIERRPGAPPCLPQGKRCGIELNLPSFIEAVHEVHSDSIGPYVDNLHRRVCTCCAIRDTEQCPCPMDYLLVLVVQAVETVDMRREAEAAAC